MALTTPPEGVPVHERPEYYYEQSAVIPVRRNSRGELDVLMITSRKGRRWVIPKGIVEPHLSPPDSAAKEAIEEAGVQGRVHGQPIGHYAYDKWGGVCQVAVFVMEVETEMDHWPEDYRQREWLSLAEAAARMDEAALQAMLPQVATFLDQEG